MNRDHKSTADKIRVMVFGTFDVLHPGHLNFFKQAKALAKNAYLIVSVARDANVKRIKKQKPLYNERARLLAVKKTRQADCAVLGGAKDYLGHILKHRPEIIALGFDQRAYVKSLKELLSERGLKVKIFRLKPYKRHLYKSSVLKKKMR